jgi:hypothetical protein
MAARRASATLQASQDRDEAAGRSTMHPFALYLAATDYERNHGAQRARRQPYAAVDALPLTEPAKVSRFDRLTAILRRRVTRVASV